MGIIYLAVLRDIPGGVKHVDKANHIRYVAVWQQLHDRRTVSRDELRKLIEAAANAKPYQGMTGPMRSLCYRVAVASGLRCRRLPESSPIRSEDHEVFESGTDRPIHRPPRRGYRSRCIDASESEARGPGRYGNRWPTDKQRLFPDIASKTRNVTLYNVLPILSSAAPCLSKIAVPLDLQSFIHTDAQRLSDLSQPWL